jgi:DNA invertase Pin-like site-specific DNA recombinase
MGIVSYYRVSTDRQGKSGLGLAAQKASVEALARARGDKIVAAFTEVESGKVNDRPELLRAIHMAKVTGSMLVIAKIDRLSRDKLFLMQLKAGMPFIAADMPNANELTVDLMIIMADHERKQISTRTREALQAAKARGQRLGAPNAQITLQDALKGCAASIQVRKSKADEHARNLKIVVEDIRSNGINTLEGIASELTTRGMLTPRGGRWHASSVRNLIARM